MSHTSLTGRKVRCDATAMSVGGTNILAIMDECQLSINRQSIDVSAPMDEWEHKEQCRASWTLQVGTLRTSTVSFAALIITGGQVVISANTDGLETFYGVGLMTGYTKNWDDPQKQSLTIEGQGLTPTIT